MVAYRTIGELTMKLWSKRVENAKTRAIEVKASNGHAANSSHDDEEEDLDVDKDLAKAKKEIGNLFAQMESLKDTIESRDLEIKRLRAIIDNNTEFMQSVIMDLIHKPATKSAAELYSEKKFTPGVGASSTAGPKGRLP